MSALDVLKQGDVDKALTELFAQVRAEPGVARHRIFLFQLLSVVGQWDRALAQLNVAQELDPSTSVMAKAYQEILHCEALRNQVFAGVRTPLLFGDPEPWLVQLVEALRLAGQGQMAAAQELRRQALEAAPAVSGTLAVAQPQEAGGPPANDEQAAAGIPFQWISDGDSRLGPVLEMIVNGRYYFAPFHRISEIVIEPPSDLRDLVWTPAQFRWSNQGETVGVIPTRYAGTESQQESALRLARLTRWQETGEDSYEGLGQRVLITDGGEFGLLDIRRISLAGAER